MSQDTTAVNDQVVADTTATESAPAETQSTEVAEVDPFVQGLNGEDAPTETETDSQETEESTAEETEVEEQPREEEKELSSKAQNRFQQLANDNRELREQIERYKAQEAQFANEQDLLNQINPETGEYYTPQEVERIAFQQSREQMQQSIAEQRYELEVQQNQQSLASEVSKVLQEFPMFDKESAEYNQDVAAQADQILEKSIIYDQNGRVIGSNVSPYQLYSTIATAAKTSAAEGQVQGQKATEKMLAQADSLTGQTPPKPKVDPFLLGFNSED